MSVRRMALVAAAVLIPLIPAAPAYAADHVYCVDIAPVGVTCDAKPSLAAAVNAANTDGTPDTIYVGAAHYLDGPYTLNGLNGHITLQGAGASSSFIGLPASVTAQTYLTAVNSTIRDLTVEMNGTNSNGDTGLSTATGSVVSGVSVSGANTVDAHGMNIQDTTVSGGSVELPVGKSANAVGILAEGGSTVAGFSIAATTGFVHSDLSLDTLSRLNIKAGYVGILTDFGPVTVDDSLIDLGTGNDQTGLAAMNSNNSAAPMSITANHLTIVGQGSGSVGAYADATASGAAQHAAIQLTNSIVSGPQTSLWTAADNDGSPGTNSTATISTSYSDWSTSYVHSGTHGTATLTSGAGHLDVDPGFRNALGGDFRLAANSPVIDKGAPGTDAPALDLNNGPRILDGNGDGIAVRDMGAYEAPKKVIVPDTTAPNTRITAHPAKRTTRRRAAFRFTSNESHVTYRCRIDRKAWRACTSPKVYLLARGWHVFRVRARDAAGNIDPTPASWRFKRI